MVDRIINYSRPSPAFPYWKRRKTGRGLGTRLDVDWSLGVFILAKEVEVEFFGIIMEKVFWYKLFVNLVNN